MKTKLWVLMLLVPLVLLILVNKKENSIEPSEKMLAVNVMVEPQEEVIETFLYDGLTKEQLIAKINRSLNSTIANKGELFVEHSLELGLDPYLAVAIVLHETGCKWECSSLVKYCNNVGGQVGKPSCNGGPYRSYKTLDEGIIGFMDNLYYNYIDKGLKTPEQIGTKYAASSSWASKINNYIAEIKAK